MNIKDFCKIGTISDWEITIVDDVEGFFVCYIKDDFTEPVFVNKSKPQDSHKVRHWKNIQKCFKNLQQAGFMGKVSMTLTSEIGHLADITDSK